jgi:hypothetical protein
MKTLVFKAPPGEGPVHLALTSGHTALVEETGTELPAHFHRAAIAQGCFPEGIPGVALQAARDPTRPEMIREKLREMIRGADPEDFTTSGQPNKANLDAKLGFVTERHEVDTAFADVLAEDDEDEGSSHDDAPAEQTRQPSATTTQATRHPAKGGKGNKGTKK